MSIFRIKNLTTGLWWRPMSYPRWAPVGKSYRLLAHARSAISEHRLKDCIVVEYAITEIAVHPMEAA